MSNETNSTQEDKELIESTIQLLVTKVHADSEPEELEALAKTIKNRFSLPADTSLHTCSEILKANTPKPRLKKAPRPKSALPSLGESQNHPSEGADFI